jgi:hypothetical protein
MGVAQQQTRNYAAGLGIGHNLAQGGTVIRRTPLIIALPLLLAACASKGDLQVAQQKAADLQAQTSALQAQLAQKDLQLSAEQVTAKDLQSKNTTLEADLSKAKDDSAQLRSQVSALKATIGKYECSSQITDMKYGSVMDASTILSAWWARQPGVQELSTPYRDKIWSNALTQIHGITYTSSEDHKPYVEHFLVYFAEFGMTPSVFWIKGQCWLDPP